MNITPKDEKELRQQIDDRHEKLYQEYKGSGTILLFTPWLESRLVSKTELAERWEGELFNVRKQLSDLQEKCERLGKLEEKWNAVKDLFDINKTAKYNII